MTRRERLERKLEKRGEWAQGRREKSEALSHAADPYRGDVAFNTQPGHIPERARVIRALDKSHEHAQMAAHHESKAAGLAGQLDRSVFSDDLDAVVQLEARIVEREGECARVKALNVAIRREMKAGLTAGWLDRIGATDRERAQIVGNLNDWRKQPLFPGWVLSNLRGRIAADRERIKAITSRQERTARAEASGGVVIEGDVYVRVTFADKPARAIIEALKTAGFQWGGGSWIGERVKLPAEVQP